MSITTTELKENLAKYLQLSQTEDIYITNHGKVIAKLCNPYLSRMEQAKSLFGILPEDISVEDAKEERFANR